MTAVLHVLSSLKLGGAERFVIDLSRLQRQQGINASILSFGATDDTLVSEARTQQIPLTISNSLSNRLGQYKRFYHLFSKVDVIQIHSPFALRFLAPLIPLFPSKKFIYTRHGLAPLTSPKWRRLHKMMRLFLHRVSFVTDAGLDSFKQNYPWAPPKLCVIENGVYVPELKRSTVARPIRIGSVGRMVPLKGQQFLVEAIRLLETNPSLQASTQPYQLHFFGSGPVESDLKAQAATLNHPERISFHGIVIERDQIYKNIDVLVVSSETEGLSLAVMEAMAHGIGVVATNVGGNPRLVFPGKTGTLVPYGDAQALAAALLSLINNPVLLAEYGQNAHDFIKQNYSLETTHKSYLACYSA
jgi:L-malate glycosyltransferase